MKGDRVEIVIDAGGSTRTYDIEATRAGRRVDVTHGRGLVENRDDGGRHSGPHGTVHGGAGARTGRAPGPPAGTGGRRCGDRAAAARVGRTPPSPAGRNSS